MDSLTPPEAPAIAAPKKKSRRSKAGTISDPPSYCVCGSGEGDMLGCDGLNCEGGGWYHVECLQAVLGLEEEAAKRLTRLRGDWLCPSCTEKNSRSQSGDKKRARTSTKTRTRTTANEYSEEEFVMSKAEKVKVLGGGIISSLPPLRVESAERQSREEMEELMASARVLSFDPSGCVSNKTKDTDFPSGLSLITLPKDIFSILKSLHETIVESLEAELRLTPWAGVGESDARKRGYAFLPSRFGKFGKTTLTAAGVRFHAAEKRGFDAKKDEGANWQSCFRLSNAQVSSQHEEALQSVVNAVAAVVPEQYKSCITLDQLQAIQPNLHNGRDHLPVHIDSPLNDGFGVVIVTICMQQAADILLQSNESSKTWFFRAPEGSLYVLAGPARNSFDHGVVCPLEKRKRELSTKLQASLQQSQAPKTTKRKKRGKPERLGRESLNLRFGLHGNAASKQFFVGTEMPLLYT